MGVFLFMMVPWFGFEKETNRKATGPKGLRRSLRRHQAPRKFLAPECILGAPAIGATSTTEKRVPFVLTSVLEDLVSVHEPVGMKFAMCIG